MKILHIDTEMSWRGGQQQAVYLYHFLLEKGFKTSFVTPPGSKVCKYLSARDLPCKTIPFWGEWDFIHGLTLANYAKKEGFNVLHLHSGHALAWGLWAKLFVPGIKLIAVRRVSCPVRQNPLSYLKYRNRLIDRFVAISDHIRKVMVSDGIAEDKIVAIHSGVNLNKKTQLPGSDGSKDKKVEKPVPDDAILIGTVAAFTKEKDYPTLLKAASQVIGERPGVYFIALGEGKLLADMKKIAAQSGINEKFIFSGFQSGVEEYLKRFNIYVMTSLNEGLGTSLLDAQAHGLPVIGTKTGGIPEIIEHEVNGLLVEPQNPEKLAEAIIKLVDDPKLRKRLGEKALETVQKFDIEKTVEKNIELYEALTNELCR